MATVSVRYIVNDVDEAIAFYTGRLGFTEIMHPAPSFAMLTRGDLRLVLSAPGGGPAGGQPLQAGPPPPPPPPRGGRPGGGPPPAGRPPSHPGGLESLRSRGRRHRFACLRPSQ